MPDLTPAKIILHANPDDFDSPRTPPFHLPEASFPFAFVSVRGPRNQWRCAKAVRAHPPILLLLSLLELIIIPFSTNLIPMEWAFDFGTFSWSLLLVPKEVTDR